MGKPLRILVTGASGFIGSALVEFLRRQGHLPIPLRRGQAKPDLPCWDPAASQIDLAPAGGLDAVVHLAGSSIARRWTKEAKDQIRRSRVQGTQLLCQALAALPQPPPVLVSASGIACYGDQGGTPLAEDGPLGTGFLAEVTRDWEAATAPAEARGIRVARLRIGLVLSFSGGPLAHMLPMFRLGLGGPLAHGRQYWSWIGLEDLLRAVLHVIETPSLQGPVNAVAPHPVTNREFTRALGRAVKRPAFLPVPAFALRLAIGPMADEALLCSARVQPAKLAASGFRFLHPEIDQALSS